MPVYTPYDGSHPLFKIGLQPLDLRDWIEVDDKLGHYLAEKDRLEALYGEGVFAEEAGTREAQLEVLELMLEHLKLEHSGTHKVLADRVEVAGRCVDLNADLPPLQIASRLVQEDLILMRRGEKGWRLAAASLCFPSSWSLREKFSKPLGEIHGPVPGFATGSRNASMIERIFDNLQVALPVRRFNWSVYSNDALFSDNRSAEHLRRKDFEKGIFLRVEHQTLRKLAKSGDILFTVRIHIDPFEVLRTHPRRQEICPGFIESLKAMTAEELAYKGLLSQVDGLIRQVEAIVRKA